MPTYSLARLADVAVTPEVVTENVDPRARSRLRRLDERDGRRPLSRQRGAGLVQPGSQRRWTSRDAGLIRFLMRERHGRRSSTTPSAFTSGRRSSSSASASATAWDSFNEFSMRYARATDDFYVPEPEDVRTQVGKPGSYSFEPVTTRSPRRPARSSQRSTRPRTRPTSGWSSWASRGSWPLRCSRSAPTPSSTGRSTRGRS